MVSRTARLAGVSSPQAQGRAGEVGTQLSSVPGDRALQVFCMVRFKRDLDDLGTPGQRV